MKNPKTYWDYLVGDGRSYQMGAQRQRVFAIDTMLKHSVSGFLDVGCGTGPMYEIVRDRKIDIGYKGTDYSPAMISVCKKSFPEASWEVEDARHLKEKDGTWDCVLLMHCLDHLDDYKAAIREAARVSKRYVCIVLWRGFVDDGDRLNDRNMYGKEEGEEPWEDTHLHEYSRKILEDEFKNNQLEIVETCDGDAINEPGKYNFMYFLKKK
jgi:ubiquinone/menaquinone biosynthesis C-methylase UbiE